MPNPTTSTPPLGSVPRSPKVVIEPQPIPDLDWARASVKLPKGVLASGWRRVGGAVELTVEVPAGTEAEIRLGGRTARVVGPWKGTRTDVP